MHQLTATEVAVLKAVFIRNLQSGYEAIQVPDTDLFSVSVSVGSLDLTNNAMVVDWTGSSPIGSVQAFITQFHLTPVVYLLLVNAILLVLGCLLEGTTILLVIVLIMVPTAKLLGLDLVHFGVVVVVNIMIGLLTPPFGLLLFVVANMTRQPLMAIVREAFPFIMMSIVVLAIITLVPETVLWLPRVMGYKG